MAGGSVLKRFRDALSGNDLLKHQQSKSKKGKAGTAQRKEQHDRHQRVITSLRDAFSPFDKKINRSKHEIIGQRHSGDQGRPELAKKQAETQRRKTYEAQKRLQGRVGGVVDRRFGERDRLMSAEDKMVERYARERLLQTSKRSKFDLDANADSDNDLLTHGGESLAFNDDFAEDDLGIEEESGEENPAKRRRFAEDPQGNGEDAGSEAEGADQSQTRKSKHDVMREVMQKSKLHKALRQQTKAENEQLVDELNESDAFDELMEDLQAYDKDHKPAALKKDDGYDLHVREMAFDRLARPSDRTKTAEELEAEAKERQEKLDADRKARMEGDELNDGLDIDVANDAELFGLADGMEDNAAPTASVVEFSDDEPEDDTLSIPQTYDALKSLLGTSDQLLKLRQLLQKVDPARKEGNLARRDRLVPLMARYAASTNDYEVFKGIVTILREIGPRHAVALGEYFRIAVDSIRSAGLKKRRSHLVTLALIGMLFSTSDQWHVVVNAAFLIQTEHLSANVDTGDALLNLFLCDLLLWYQRLSKRYIPEVPSTLLRILGACSPTAEEALVSRLVRPASPPFKADLPKKAKPTDLQIGKLDFDPVQAILISARTADSASSLWRSLPAYPEVFGPIHELLKPFSANVYVSGVCDRLSRTLKFALQDRRPLQLQNLQPVALITHAPMFDSNYNPEVKGHDQDPERRELARLKAQLKKERKSTLKEIRRDAEFESRQKLQESRDEMTAYHAKLARITNQINSEEGAERNLYEREKRRHKK